MRAQLRAVAIGVLAAALMSPCVAAAQSTADNAAKYESLRERLRAEFVVVGEGQGQGLPAHIRADTLGYIRWADATIDLAWYLAVLATEHRMLSQPTRYPGFAGDLAQTEDELYYALLALERLDRVANASFDAPCTQSEELDGFFIRDDVHADFHTNFGLSETRSDFLDGPTQKEESQDQAWHLVMGLGLVGKLVPPGTAARGRDLPAWAYEQLVRIVGHIQSHEFFVTNPACMDRRVARGENGFGYAAGVARAMEFLSDGEIVYPVTRTWTTIWETLRSPTNPGYSNVDNLHMAMTVAAVGGGFAPDTIDVLAELAAVQGWWVYPMVHVALHGEAGAPRWCLHRDEIESAAAAQLDELPASADPASPRPGRAPHSFTTSNRFIRGAELAYVGAEGSEGQRFHGLDYMLLHNARALAAPSTWEAGDAPAPGVCAPPLPDAGGPRTDAGVADAGPGGDEVAGCSCRATGSLSGGASHPLAMLLAVACSSARLRRRARRPGRRQRRASLSAGS